MKKHRLYNNIIILYNKLNKKLVIFITEKVITSLIEKGKCIIL
jgi:hypothetical protein